MSVNFLISDMVSRMNLAARSNHAKVVIRPSKYCSAVLKVLLDNGVIQGFCLDRGVIIIDLKFHRNRCVFKRLVLISKPSRRVFWRLGNLSVKHNLSNFSGFFIISTSNGLIDSNNSLLSSHKCGEIILKVEL